MTKVMLIAGVAALAITTPAVAGPHGGGGGHGGGNAFAQQSRGNARAGRGGGFAAPRMQQRAQPQRQARAFQMQRSEQRQARVTQIRQRSEQRQARAMQVRQRSDQRQARAMQVRQSEQRQARASAQRNERRAMAQRQNQMRQARALQQDRRQQQARIFQERNQRVAENRDQQRQARIMQEQRIRAARVDQRQAIANNRMAQAERIQALRQDQRAQLAAREFARNDFATRYASVRNRGLVDGCPPGLWAKNNGCLPPGQAMRLVGSPVSKVASMAALAEVPQSLRYVYPDTPNYYYRYGDGYMYQVDRSSNLVNSLLPLVGGGYLPGMTLPASYMNSYVPDYYGYNSFYQDSPYANYRYMDGNVYGVDPYSGTIQDVIPTYAYGYGVGQMLPAGYDYYNVPTDYRSLYYNTPDSNYWYAPGAIYNVDPSTQLITSVASLLAPGLSVGQALPMGYNTYNVPLAYRSTYYDTPNAWYRYNNGNIYQVDPTTQLVTGIVASLLT